MSTRALRRMQAAAASNANPEDEGSDSQEDDSEQVQKSSAGNKFDSLMAEEEEQDKGVDEELDDASQPAAAKASKKKKKKSNKKAAKKETSSSAANDDDWFLEEAVRSNAASSAAAASLASKTDELFDDSVLKDLETTRSQSLCSKFGLSVKDAMSLNAKYLNPAEEVRYRFGTQINGPTNAPRGHRGALQRRFGGSKLVTPRPNWPLPGRTGLSMRQVDQSAAGLPTFTFEHDNAYAQAQQEFWIAVESMSPDEIAAVHRKHPYHIDTLLQLAELCLTAEDPQSAADLVERAIFAMESSLHHNFILTRLGSRVLDFRYFESRSFYLALFRHITLLGRKGCTRTAFELSKLLLSLDFKRDPMCALLFLDFYALRAQCYAELIAIYDDMWREKSLDWLPNFAYSIALACFRLSTLATSSSASASGMLTSKNYIPNAPAGEILAVAKSLMFDALTRFPSVLLPLLESCSVKPDGRLAACKWFVASQADAKNEPNAMKALQSLYVTRCSTVWKDIDTLHWLETVVAEFVETLPGEEASRRAVRERAISGFQQRTGRNVLRHLVLSGHREPIGFVSSELPFQAAIFSYDPLPPPDAIWNYTRTNPRRGRGANAEASSPLDLFASFFASLLPNYNPAEQNQAQLRLDNFVRAFRDVFAGLHLEPPPVEAGGQQPQQPQAQERFDLADLTDSDDEGEENARGDDHNELD